MLKKQSDAQILQFIRELPGGNPTQYAKLLGTTAIRINNLLHDGEGRRIVRAGMIKMAPKGYAPTWAMSRTERGSLRAADVDLLMREKRLPPFIADMLEKVHVRFRDDALNFLREALEQTSNHVSFRHQMESYMEQDRHRTEEMLRSDLRIAQLTHEITRFDRILEQTREMALALSDRRVVQTTIPNAEIVAETEVAE